MIFQYFTKFNNSHQDLSASVYLAVGERESQRMIGNTVKFKESLNSGKHPNLIVRTTVFENEHHRSLFPPAFTKGMQYLFSEDREK
jgi:hypothetical protein